MALPSIHTSTSFRSGFVIALLGAIMFSTKAIFVKLAFASTHVNAITLLTLRMLFSLPFYILIAIYSSTKEKSISLNYKQWLSVGALGLLGYYLSSLFDFIGLKYISAGLERLILFLYPTFSVLINTFLYKAKLSKIQVVALALTYIGIGLAYLGELKVDAQQEGFFYGSIMVLLCAVTYSFYLVGTGSLVNKVGATRYTAYAMLFASGGVFLHFLVTESWQQMVFTPTLIGYSSCLALIATVIPSFMISNAMKRIGSNNVSIVTSLGPVSTILQAHFILKEKIFAAQVVGTIIVLMGVLLISYKPKMTVGNA